MRALDAHLHLWDPSVLDYPWLAGALDARFAEGEARSSADTRLADAVFVEAGCRDDQQIDEVRWVSGIASAVGVRGIVAGARLDRGRETSERLDALAAFELVVGIRHNLQGEPDGLAATSAFRDGAREVAARGWAFDACVRAHQIADVDALAASVPELRIVLDHLGKPAVGTAGAPARPEAAWLHDVGQLARHPNVWCKLSGLPAEAAGGWDAAQIEPFLDAALEAFGPDRLLWGSDWPVSAVGPDGYRSAGRTAWLDAVTSWAASRGVDQEAVLRTNAERCYGIR